MTRTIINRASIRRRGSASIVALILLVAIACLGMIVGLVEIRDQVTQEFGDAAVALDHLDQSYSVLVEIDTDDDDIPDTVVYQAAFADPEPTLSDPDADIGGDPPAGLTFNSPTPGESGSITPAGTLP
ncbi:MAG: hypothetical protein WDZ51_03225 [Pirellulaceae bacterium]